MVGWRYIHLTQRLQKLLQEVRGDAKQIPLSATSQLAVSLDLQRQHLRSLEKQLEAVRQTLYLAPIGYLQVDEENRLIFANPQACQLLDFQAPDVTGARLLLELVRSFELDSLIEQTRREQTLCQRDWTFHRVSTDPARISRQPSCPLRGYGIPLAQDQVGIFIEDRQEAVTLAQQRDRWASDVAHELKTPLTSIRLVAETLRSRVEPTLTTWIDRLLNETIRLSTLVQDLLDLSQIERGSPYCLNLAPVNLPDLIRRAWLSLEPLAAQKQLTLDYVGPDQLVMKLNEPRMLRALLNLLDNGIQYSPSHSVIQVQLAVVPSSDTAGSESQSNPSDAASFPSHVQLDIIDAGIGFQEKDLPYIFERFYRSDTARTRSASTSGLSSRTAYLNESPIQAPISGGSGLGLSIVRQIVIAHQGSVTAQNHPETGGGWLQIQLPYTPTQPTPPA